MPTKNELVMTPAVISGTPAPIMPARKEMTVQDLWGILSRRRGIVLGVLLLTIVVAGILFATSTRLYSASAEIQVQKESADALSMDTMMGAEPTSDSVESNVNLQTQAQILQSDSLALQVIKELNLEEAQIFAPTSAPSGGSWGCLRQRVSRTREMYRWRKRRRAAQG